MSVVVTARIFWTTMNTLSYWDKAGKIVTVSGAVCKLVLLAIGDSADDYGENSYQSFDTIAKKSSVEKRTVIRAVRALTTAGFIALNGVSRYGTNDYTIDMKKLGTPPEKRSKNGRPKTGDCGAETSDSTAETSDSTAETSDLQSPDPSLKRPYPSFNGSMSEKSTFISAFQSAVAGNWNILDWRKVERALDDPAVTISRVDHTIRVDGLGMQAAMFQDRYARSLSNGLVGVLNENVKVEFTYQEAL